MVLQKCKRYCQHENDLEKPRMISINMKWSYQSCVNLTIVETVYSKRLCDAMKVESILLKMV